MISEELTFDTYCPSYLKKVRVNSHKHRLKRVPLFVGYLFVGFDIDLDDWGSIGQTKGVYRLLGIGSIPVPIAEDVISYIRKVEEEYQLSSNRIVTPLSIGKLVRVLEPLAFAGLFGYVSNINARTGMVEIELDIFGRKTRISTASDKVVLV